MRRLIVNEFMSLDGVCQAPGGADEDTDGGFEHAGWHMRFMGDESAHHWVVSSIVDADGFLLGRRTYEIFAAYWPNAPEEQQVVAEALNTKPKYIVSSTLADPLPWQNATVLGGDLASSVASLKGSGDGDLQIIGSTQLVRALLQHSLVDELRLMIDPLVLGGGKRIFSDDGALKELRLVDGQVSSTGAFLATYSATG